MPSRTASKTFGSIRPALTEPAALCRSCAHTLRRQYASAAATAAVEPASIPVDSLASQGAYKMCAGVVLSRPPQITRDLDPFEKAFFLYQRRLNERLALPFTRYFYYRKKTPGIVDFVKKLKARRTPARDIGHYNAYDKDGWNDEVVVGVTVGEPEQQKEALLKDEQPYSEDDDPAKALLVNEQQKRPLSRVTEADEKNDLKSLNRALQKTLYLLVQDSQGRWRFPQAGIDMQNNESMRNAASRILETTAGIHMNTWIVGNHPIGHVEDRLFQSKDQAAAKSQEDAKKNIVFLMKGRIMAGQANIEKNAHGVKDFKWLSREEIQDTVHEGYWSAIKDVLPQQ